MPAKTALITGALGQDGTLLSEWLLSQDYRVVGVVREGHAARASSAELIALDLSDPVAVRTMLERYRPDEIYHLAAHHHSSQETAKDSELDAAQGMVGTNFSSTQTLAFAMLETGTKASLVFAGSSQMYTAAARDERISELTPRRPSTFYGHTKTWSVDLLQQLRTDFGLRAATAILFNHESRLRGGQFLSRKVTQAAAAIRSGRTVGLEVLNTLARTDWCSASDTVRALHLMAASTKPRDYVIASGALHSVEDLLAVAFEHCGLDWHDHVSVREARQRPALCGDPALIEAELGWRRCVSFEDLIREMVDHDLRLLGAPPARSLSA
jgi:GDPmannose 4,6-dehydratase